MRGESIFRAKILKCRIIEEVKNISGRIEIINDHQLVARSRQLLYFIKDDLTKFCLEHQRF